MTQRQLAYTMTVEADVRFYIPVTHRIKGLWQKADYCLMGPYTPDTTFRDIFDDYRKISYISEHEYTPKLKEHAYDYRKECSIRYCMDQTVWIACVLSWDKRRIEENVMESEKILFGFTITFELK